MGVIFEAVIPRMNRNWKKGRGSGDGRRLAGTGRNIHFTFCWQGNGKCRDYRSREKKKGKKYAPARALRTEKLARTNLREEGREERKQEKENTRQRRHLEPKSDVSD